MFPDFAATWKAEHYRDNDRYRSSYGKFNEGTKTRLESKGLKDLRSILKESFLENTRKYFLDAGNALNVGG